MIGPLVLVLGHLDRLGYEVHRLTVGIVGLVPVSCRKGLGDLVQPQVVPPERTEVSRQHPVIGSDLAAQRGQGVVGRPVSFVVVASRGRPGA